MGFNSSRYKQQGCLWCIHHCRFIKFTQNSWQYQKSVAINTILRDNSSIDFLVLPVAKSPLDSPCFKNHSPILVLKGMFLRFHIFLRVSSFLKRSILTYLPQTVYVCMPESIKEEMKANIFWEGLTPSVTSSFRKKKVQAFFKSDRLDEICYGNHILLLKKQCFFKTRRRIYLQT